jgi:hypothetical protein
MPLRRALPLSPLPAFVVGPHFAFEPISNEEQLKACGSHKGHGLHQGIHHHVVVGVFGGCGVPGLPVPLLLLLLLELRRYYDKRGGQNQQDNSSALLSSRTVALLSINRYVRPFFIEKLGLSGHAFEEKELQ